MPSNSHGAKFGGALFDVFFRRLSQTSWREIFDGKTRDDGVFESFLNTIGRNISDRAKTPINAPSITPLQKKSCVLLAKLTRVLPPDAASKLQIRANKKEAPFD
ncbi:MAG: hypothetical protein IK077_04505 [Thermoguttaceae bacterium]|nr:hypothetical protein [Thermoguttaceae bacterium]